MIATSVVAGFVAALSGVVSFVILHAFPIMPAWSTVRASAAIVIGGAVVGWVHGESRVLPAVAAFIGWRWSHRARGAIVFAIAALALTSLTGGPFPVTTSRPALGLFLGFLPIFTFCGAVLALAAQRISQSTRAMTPAAQPES